MNEYWELIEDEVIMELTDSYPGSEIEIKEHDIVEASDRAAHDITNETGTADLFLDVELLLDFDGTDAKANIIVWFNTDTQMVRAARIISFRAN